MDVAKVLTNKKNLVMLGGVALCILVATLGICLLTGCGKKDQPTTATTTESQETPTENTEETEVTESSEVADEEEVKVALKASVEKVVKEVMEERDVTIAYEIEKTQDVASESTQKKPNE